MPVIFAIHERKFKSTHTEMTKIDAQELPFLASNSTKKLVPFVTYDEKGFFEAVDSHLPNIRRFLCWNHAINAIKFWLGKHGATASVKFQCTLVIFGICFTKKLKWNTVNGWKS